MVQVTRDTSWEQVQALTKAAQATRGVRDEFVLSVQQSLRIEGYVLSEEQVRTAVETVIRRTK